MKDFDYKNYLKSNPLLKVEEKKDHDGDGDIDSDDYLAARDKAIKKAKGKIKEIIISVLNEVKKDEHGNHLEPQFKKGDKVTYLGNPGEITKINKTASGTYTYSVSYDKGTGKTKASDLYNKGGEIKKA